MPDPSGHPFGEDSARSLELSIQTPVPAECFTLGWFLTQSWNCCFGNCFIVHERKQARQSRLKLGVGAESGKFAVGAVVQILPLLQWKWRTWTRPPGRGETLNEPIQMANGMGWSGGGFLFSGCHWQLSISCPTLLNRNRWGTNGEVGETRLTKLTHLLCV